MLLGSPFANPVSLPFLLGPQGQLLFPQVSSLVKVLFLNRCFLGGLQLVNLLIQ